MGSPPQKGKKKAVSVLVRVVLFVTLLCQWHPTVPTPAITSCPFACCLMQPGGSAIEGPCVAVWPLKVLCDTVCQHGDLPFSPEKLLEGATDNDLSISKNCCLTKKKKTTKKPPANENCKIDSRAGMEDVQRLSYISLRWHHLSIHVSHAVANQWHMITRRFESPSCCFLILPDSNPKEARWKYCIFELCCSFTNT